MMIQFTEKCCITKDIKDKGQKLSGHKFTKFIFEVMAVRNRNMQEHDVKYAQFTCKDAGMSPWSNFICCHRDNTNTAVLFFDPTVNRTSAILSSSM